VTVIPNTIKIRLRVLMLTESASGSIAEMVFAERPTNIPSLSGLSSYNSTRTLTSAVPSGISHSSSNVRITQSRNFAPFKTGKSGVIAC
jgi:hypothetical protein